MPLAANDPTGPSTALSVETLIPRAWYRSRFVDFEQGNALAQLGSLAAGGAGAGFATQFNEQIRAWEQELRVLTQAISFVRRELPAADEWTLFLEFQIPRRERRIDAVVLAGSVILTIEFKIGGLRFDRASTWQAEDYALDLRDFHSASRNHPVVPMLVATHVESAIETSAGTEVSVWRVGNSGLGGAIIDAVRTHTDALSPNIDPGLWENAGYRPAPTIVEATQRLFRGHSVSNLSHHYADNLHRTVDAIVAEVVAARTTGARTVCFVTGVPGAGKTLTGLEAVHRPEVSGGSAGLAAFLSGNGPLVGVLREALVRDAMSQGELRPSAVRRASSLIQIVHKFVEEYGIKHRDLEPHEHVVVYDEAQRGWDREKVGTWHMADYGSEAAIILDAMARKSDWAVVIALVGGGQEIHSGEAGLAEWGRALAESEVPWRVVASPEVLTGGTAVAGHRLFEGGKPIESRLMANDAMHLGVSVRSPRAAHIADWVNAVINIDANSARASLKQVRGFRMGLTRDLEAARTWLRDAARDERRAGLLASSGALRLRACGLEMDPAFQRQYPTPRWFLDPASDVRSSHRLEVALREFECQGLELDYVGLCWGDDLTMGASGQWDQREFRGSRWYNVKNAVRRRYALNKYRVLLTRAREGMVVWVPRGDPADPTRDPNRLDRTAEFLLEAGLPSID